jgi:Flp pilus assembly protein TadG
MRQKYKDLPFDQRGGVLVEAAVMIPIIFVFVLGAVDFLFAFYQWNAATKAVQLGARIAAVSNPVASDVSAITGLGGGVNPGDPMTVGAFLTRTCFGATASCTNGTYSAAAMTTIVRGRGSNACGDATSVYFAGMCDVFARVREENVVISYSATGLGYAGRVGGPVPTITVSLQNLPFQFFFLNALMGFGNINIPSMTTTITGEDLSSNAYPPLP